jgi:sugar lactone lactonase YvrE
VTITSTSFEFNMGCVFDSHGNLWVVDGSANGVHEISHAQLVAATLAGPAPQNITPAVTITSTALSSPAFATFDAGGNLWVTSEANNNIVEFAATDLGNPAATPHVIISSPSVDGPGQPQFDAAGNLWVTNALNNTVVKFTPAQLAASSSPTADAIISDDGSGSLVTPWGCAFDSLGRLWVLNYGPTTATSTTATISRFGRGQLAVSGPSSPTPRQTLDGLQPFAAQMTFGPRY